MYQINNSFSGIFFIYVYFPVAECVADIFTGDPEEVQYYRIAAGKILRDWIEEPETVQKKKV